MILIDATRKLAEVYDGVPDGAIAVVVILAVLVSAYLILGSAYEGDQE